MAKSFPTLDKRYTFIDLGSSVNGYRIKPKKKKKACSKIINLLKTESKEAAVCGTAVLGHRHELTSFIFATLGNFAL